MMAIGRDSCLLMLIGWEVYLGLLGRSLAPGVTPSLMPTLTAASTTSGAVGWNTSPAASLPLSSAPIATAPIDPAAALIREMRKARLVSRAFSETVIGPSELMS
jgi:hypothetical protein